MKWFKHYSNAHRDAKLKKLVMKYGAEGYGVYWYCVEEIASAVTSDNFTFELEHDAEIIAHDLNMPQHKVEEMMKTMVDLQLFDCDRGVISCIKMMKFLEQSMTSNPEMRLIISNHKKAQNHDSVMTSSDNVVTASRADKIRLDKNRKTIGRFAPPTHEEVSNYCDEKGFADISEDFIDFYESKGWLVGKNKMKDWKAAARRWARSNGKATEEQLDFVGVRV